MKNDVFEQDKRSRDVLEQPLVDFDPFSDPKGRPKGTQELPGEVRGPSWEDLGRSWGDLEATCKAVRFGNHFLIDFEHQKSAQREAFEETEWTPNRPRNVTKSKSFFKNGKKRFRSRLGGF